MAERVPHVAVFHAGPKRGAGEKARAGSTTARTAGSPGRAATGSGTTSGARRWYQRLVPDRGPRAERPAAKGGAKPAGKGGAKPAAGAGSKAAGSKARAAGSRRPAKPVLQRGSLGSVVARTAVLGLAVVAMVAFAVLLAKATLVPSPTSVDLVHTNLRPGASIRAYLDQPALRDTVKQIGGNVVLGMPFGVLLPALFPRARGLVRVMVVTALVMVTVEAIQGTIVEGRAFDIDDVILNTSGALIGYLLLGRRLGRALYPRRTHWWHRLGFGTPPDQQGAPGPGARNPARTRAGTSAASGSGSGVAGWFRRDRPPARKRR